MSHTIDARNVNDAFAEGWWQLRTSGGRESSRNGPVLVMPGPVITTYHMPTERVLFNSKRDANPVFHLMEAIWMMAGENRVEWLAQFNSGIARYAEDDGKVWGAYGHRWINHFPVAHFATVRMHQLQSIVDILRSDPGSRQAVLQMWDPSADLTQSKLKDRPCNTAAYFDLRGGKLNMTVTCRSNDMLWGAYGANAVHFSFLQEALACALDVTVGVYRQFSNNFHVYADLPMVQYFLDNPPTDPYNLYDIRHDCVVIPIMQRGESLREFMNECELFCLNKTKFANKFLQTVAYPLKEAYLARKRGEPMPREIPDCDWKIAYTEWCERRNADVSK